MTGLTLEHVVADLANLPPLPEVVIEILECFQHDNVDTDEIADKIARDQALAARSLRIANSSFYGLQTRVASIHDAMIVLGFRAVRTLVTAASVTSRFGAIHVEGFDQRGFWLHNAGSALAARALAGRVGAAADVAFTAGLLHDLGRLALVVRHPAHYTAVREYRERHDCQWLDAEHDVLGFDHTHIGAALARRWRFATVIEEAVAGHHAPDALPAKSLAGIVHVADIVSHVLEFDPHVEDLVPRLSEVAWHRLGLGWRDFRELLAEVDRQRGTADLLLPF